jgi:hypothetical protein
LFKDPVAEKKEKMRQRDENKRLKKESPLKVHEKEKKEGMGFEKKVAKQWNDRMRSKPTKAIAKPRLGISTETQALSPQTFPVQAKSVFEREEAQRQPNSGAGWAAKGDIKLEHALMECKERGTVNARGEKQITIPKLWITKQEQEAFQEQRPYWYIPFGYKGDEEVYLVKSYNHEMEMIFEMRQQRERIEDLERQIKYLRDQEV